ncbi:uncharacterized protein LOC133337199 [Musca vetustissima]|uniref:uncharacterized protein LOC133337199 n=1 Tax=Musca vetustissima TaxID=27455 RepID=UPI002AB7297C|nr:uncharacterized protein LOC133337199 [Musca vetustissima]
MTKLYNFPWIAKKRKKKMQKFQYFKYFLVIVLSLRTVLAEVKWYTAPDGNKYMVDDGNTYNWYDSLTECAKRGLTLVSITTEEKNEALLTGLRQLNIYEFWLGGVATNFRDRGVVFSWISSGEDFDYTYWRDNEPNGRGEEKFTLALVCALLGVAAADVSHLSGAYDYPKQDSGYNYNGPVQQGGYHYEAPAQPQQTYLPPAQPQQTYLPPAQPQQTYLPPAQPQQTYLPPAQPQQTYLPPAQPQQTYLPPAQPQQTYLPPAQPQQTYLPPAEPQQTYLPPAQPQQTYLPPAQPQQTYLPPSEGLGQDGYHYRTVKRYRFKSH